MALERPVIPAGIRDHVPTRLSRDLFHAKLAQAGRLRKAWNTAVHEHAVVDGRLCERTVKVTITKKFHVILRDGIENEGTANASRKTKKCTGSLCLKGFLFLMRFWIEEFGFFLKMRTKNKFLNGSPYDGDHNAKAR